MELTLVNAEGDIIDLSVSKVGIDIIEALIESPNIIIGQQTLRQLGLQCKRVFCIIYGKSIEFLTFIHSLCN